MDPTKQYLTQYFFFIKLNKMEKEVELMKKVAVSQKNKITGSLNLNNMSDQMFTWYRVFRSNYMDGFTTQI